MKHLIKKLLREELEINDSYRAGANLMATRIANQEGFTIDTNALYDWILENPSVMEQIYEEILKSTVPSSEYSDLVSKYPKEVLRFFNTT